MSPSLLQFKSVFIAVRDNWKCPCIYWWECLDWNLLLYEVFSITEKQNPVNIEVNTPLIILRYTAWINYIIYFSSDLCYFPVGGSSYIYHYLSNRHNYKQFIVAEQWTDEVKYKINKTNLLKC